MRPTLLPYKSNLSRQNQQIYVRLNFKICVFLKDLITPAVIISSLFIISKLLKTADPFSPKTFCKTQAPSY